MVGSSRVVATMIASALLAGQVRAQPAPSAADKQQAQDLVKQAIANSEANDHGRAIELYLEAYEIVPLPTLLSNVGTEYQAGNKPVLALKYFCMYLTKDPSGPLQGYARDQVRQLQGALGHADLEVCAPMPAAGTDHGTSSDAGTAAAAGTTAGPDAGTSADPGGASGLESGTTATQDLAVSARARPRDPGKPLKLVGVVGAGLGVAALGAGFYFGARAKTISDDIETWPMTVAWRADILDYEAEGARAERLQIAGLVAGGALVIGGTILYFVGRAKTSAAKERITIAPTAGASGGGVVFAGAF